MSFSERLSNCLKENKMSLGKLALKSGISTSSISRYISGERKPSDKALIKIAYTLKVNPRYLDCSSNSKFISNDELKVQYSTIMNTEIEQDNNSFSKRLSFLMEFYDICQVDLCNALDIKKSSMSKYLSGSNLPKFNLLIKIADYFNVSIDYLVGRTCLSQLYKNDKNILEKYKDIFDILESNNISSKLKNENKYILNELISNACKSFDIINEISINKDYIK